MSDKPVLWGGRSTDHQAVEAARALERTADAVYARELEIRYQVEIEHIEAEALAEVVKNSLELEMNVLDEALAQAGGSAAKARLIGDKIDILRKLDSERLLRHFGGR